MPKRATPHIKRFEVPAKKTYGWVAELQRHNRLSNKMFSDSIWGGKQQALEAAKAWCAQQTEVTSEYAHQLWLRNNLRRNNTSGIAGVGRYERSEGDTGSAFWLATWLDEHGKKRKRKFSVKRWGEEGARKKAMELRELETHKATAAKTGMRSTDGHEGPA